MPPADPAAAGTLSRRLARGTAWSLVMRAAGMVGGFVTAALAARLLDRSEFGAYALATSLVAIGAILGRFGLPMAIIRLSAQARAHEDGSRVRAVIATGLRLGTVGAVAVTIVLAAGGGRFLARSLFESPALASVMLLVAVWTGVEALRIVCSETFRGLGAVRAALVLGDNGQAVLSALCFAGLAVASGTTSLRVAVAACLGASCVMLLVSSLALARRVRLFPRVAGVRVGAGTLLAIALPLSVMDVTGLFVNQGDLWVVGAFRPDADVALYSAAARLALFFAVPLFVINAVLAPIIAELHATGQMDRLERVVRGSVTAASIPAVAGLAVVLAFGRPLLSAIYGSADFGDGALILAVLTTAVVFGVVAGPCNLALMMTGHHRIVAGIAVVVLVLTIAGEVLGMHVAGLTGVAVASAGGTVLQNALALVVARRRLGIWTMAVPRWRAVEALRDL